MNRSSKNLQILTLMKIRSSRQKDGRMEKDIKKLRVAFRNLVNEPKRKRLYPLQHWLTGSCHRDVVFTTRYEMVFKYNRLRFVLEVLIILKSTSNISRHNEIMTRQTNINNTCVNRNEINICSIIQMA
jgi:hypothetical protein